MQRDPTQRIALGLIGLAALSTVVCLVRFPLDAATKPMFALLAAMAILSEFMPVELSRHGMRITFTLPYIAAMAVTLSPSCALFTDFGATLIAGMLYPIARKQTTGGLWMALNAAVAALGVSAGVAAMLVGGSLMQGQTSGQPQVQALSFMAGYGVTNLLLVMYIDWVSIGRPPRDNVLSALQVGASSVILYALLALTVTVFAHKQLALFIPLTLVPVWALRTGLDYQAKMYEHYYETVSALSLMLQRAHPYTHGHLERVAISAEEVALRLGLTPQKARLVREAAVLHDIGKIAVSEEILDKPAKLDEQEMNHVRRHSIMGAQILAPVKQFHEMVPWVRHHHERPDGQGYPDRLTDVEIPIESKIIAVVDAFDAMTGGDHPLQKRTYRDPMSVPEAIAELERCSGTQFDPEVVGAFRDVILEEAS